MDIEGRVVIVTGAGAGLGRELAVAFARAGGDVVVADLDEAAAKETTELVRAAGRRAWPVQVDVRDDRACAALVRQAESVGGPHVLVNNAGGWGPGEQYPRADRGQWTGVLDLNLRAPMLLTQLCLGPMDRVGGGVVVNIGSSAGVGADGYGSPEYAAAKAGLTRFTTALADLPATHRVRVTCVVPGWIGLARAHEELAAMSAVQRAAAEPLVPPEDVTRAVLDLVRDDTRSGTVVELLG